MQRLEGRHADHRRAVGVGDDSLWRAVEVSGVHLGHDERDVGVHAPGRGVVDDDHARVGDARSETLGRRPTCREQGHGEAAVVGGLCVLDFDVVAGPGKVAPCRTGRGEVAHARDGKATLGEHRTHHATDLSGRADDPDVHDFRLPVAFG